MTPQTTAAVLIGVVVVGGAAVLFAKHAEEIKVANTAFDAAKPLSTDIGVRKVGGKLVNRDGTPATTQSINEYAKLNNLNPKDVWLQKV